MILIAAMAAAAWMTTGMSVSSFMARRGRDPVSWRVVGLLFGPVTWFFAWIELRWTTRRGFEVVERGEHSGGDFDLLVVSFEGPPEPLVAALETVRHRIGRLVVARVMPGDAGSAWERQAVEDLRVDRDILGFQGAELVLLFGPHSAAIADYAQSEKLHAVVVDRDIPDLSDRLEGSGVVLLSITEAEPVPAGQRRRARRCARHTRMRPTAALRWSAGTSWR